MLGSRYHRLNEPSRGVESMGRMGALWGAVRDFGTKSASVPFVVSVARRPSFLLVHPPFLLPTHSPRTPYTDDNGAGMQNVTVGYISSLVV